MRRIMVYGNISKLLHQEWLNSCRSKYYSFSNPNFPGKSHETHGLRIKAHETQPCYFLDLITEKVLYSAITLLKLNQYELNQDWLLYILQFKMGSWSINLKVKNEEINASEAGLELFSDVILVGYSKCYDMISMK